MSPIAASSEVSVSALRNCHYGQLFPENQIETQIELALSVVHDTKGISMTILLLTMFFEFNAMK